jgi:CheY-like chemotaxis protein
MNTKRISSKDAPPNIEEPPAPAPSPSEPLVLVVDDTVDNAVVISLDLQNRGYRVVTAMNGEEAMKVAEMMRPDIILMDIGMPQLDGIEATRLIRADETLQKIPVIAITAFTTDVFRRAAYEVGFDGYLTKPIEFERLHLLIQKLLQKSDEQ